MPFWNFNGTLKEQLISFDESLNDFGFNAKRRSSSWLEAFSKLKELIKCRTENKKVIFIDELSWMDTPKSDLLKALEYFWNNFASARKDILLIICSSATSWVINKVIHNKGGLYNRLTEGIHLLPLKLNECEEFLNANNIFQSRGQILEYYMVFGGVPFYWTFIKKGLSVGQNIDRMFFDNSALLKDEHEYLYASIFKNPEKYIRIIEALAKNKSGLSREEIIEKTKIENTGNLSLKLEELELCGFIKKYYAFGSKKKNALYQLIDNYTIFYYTFIKENQYDNAFFSNQLNSPKINTWHGFAFERVCLEHIDEIKHKLGISGVLTNINSWRTKEDLDKGIYGSQIDLLIVRKDQIINLCEMKYSSSDYTIDKDFETSLNKKINDLVKSTNTKYAIYPTLITTYGVTENQYSSIIQSEITLNDLF